MPVRPARPGRGHGTLLSLCLRYRRLLWAAGLVLIMATPLAAFTATSPVGARHPDGVTSLAVPSGARVLVFAPHPDDETLGAGGLIQAALRQGGQVRVVFFTSGDGFRLAGERTLGRLRMHPGDFRQLGELRQEEARQAISHLGLGGDDAAFLGFPDRGISRLWREHWSGKPFRSPYTGATAVPYKNTAAPGAPYTGAELLRQVGDEMSRFQPTLVVMPGPQDHHPDHLGTHLFATRALDEARQRGETWAPGAAIWEYTIHADHWPSPLGLDSLRGKAPAPVPLSAGNAPWRKLDLTSAEEEAKRAALDAHKSQVRVMSRFLYSFVQPVEYFQVRKRPGDQSARTRGGAGS